MYNIDSVKSYHVSCLISTPSVSSFSIPLQFEQVKYPSGIKNERLE